MKWIIVAFCIVYCMSVKAVPITETHYMCDGYQDVVVDYDYVIVDGKRFDYLAPATGTGINEKGENYDITGAEYEGGYIFVRGESTASGLLVHKEDFSYCEAK